ncbi:hypothetical protein HJC23_006942 [Cyclotella cryptica]|uniref:PSI-F n=1 Tax=Cyclotella cryptica TaxID=29204 RepID=A0ABD3QM94_9STRA|eukprot:CCRYP_004271-RA/>CCRYP_004271-RA protein AED:0.18 eAED:0.18 QI:255/1/1/1/1/1/2/616/182
MNQSRLSLSQRLPIVLLILTALLAVSSSAFGLGKSKVANKLPLPTLNKETNRWEKSPLDDGKYPYDAIGSALRHGPSPFLTRVFNGDEYEQGVLKYMATAKVDRAEATGNIDAKLNNPIDWAYQKMEEKNGKPKVDYTRLDKKQAALTIVWALGITPLAINVIVNTADQFINNPGPSVIKGL